MGGGVNCSAPPLSEQLTNSKFSPKFLLLIKVFVIYLLYMNSTFADPKFAYFSGSTVRTTLFYQEWSRIKKGANPGWDWPDPDPTIRKNPGSNLPSRKELGSGKNTEWRSVQIPQIWIRPKCHQILRKFKIISAQIIVN